MYCIANWYVLYNSFFTLNYDATFKQNMICRYFFAQTNRQYSNKKKCLHILFVFFTVVIVIVFCYFFKQNPIA